ncbi:MAG: ribose-phosphate pyrophosphokinase, partial [Woeseiaceae bacterium]|nr:ribose-phosphate pyrophosphokinase [Woeseiaceae bacterium]
MDLAKIAIFSGNAHPELAHDIARCLHLPLARAHVGRFSDGEFNVEILENIRGRETFIVQPTCPPAAENLMELLVMVDACKRASASRITAVMPYFGFARQDRRPRASRVPITAKLVAKLIGAAGVDRVLTVDLHADQIQGFFDIAVDNVYASPLLLADVWNQMYEDMVVVSPDVGGVVRARALAKRLGDADLVIIDKRRDKANQSEVMNIIGEVKGKNCVMIDDMVDTAGTLCHAAKALKQRGAKSVAAFITHAVLSGPAVGRITESDLDEVVVTDTIPLNEEAKACSKIRQLSTANLL